MRARKSWSPGSALFVLAAGLKDIAARLPGGASGQFGAAIFQAASEWEDWFCGDGPRPHVIDAAGEMLAFAGTLEVGALRNGVVREAGILMEKSFGALQGRTAEVTAIAN